MKWKLKISKTGTVDNGKASSVWWSKANKVTDKVIKLKTDDELVLEQSNDSILEKALLIMQIVNRKMKNISKVTKECKYTNEKEWKYNSPRN